MNATQIGWFNPATRRFRYIDEAECAGFTTPVYAIEQRTFGQFCEDMQATPEERHALATFLAVHRTQRTLELAPGGTDITEQLRPHIQKLEADAAAKIAERHGLKS